jgi:hypothetical protein
MLLELQILPFSLTHCTYIAPHFPTYKGNSGLSVHSHLISTTHFVVPLLSLESESQDIWMLLSDNQEDP